MGLLPNIPSFELAPSLSLADVVNVLGALPHDLAALTVDALSAAASSAASSPSAPSVFSTDEDDGGAAPGVLMDCDELDAAIAALHDDPLSDLQVLVAPCTLFDICTLDEKLFVRFCKERKIPAANQAGLREYRMRNFLLQVDFCSHFLKGEEPLASLRQLMDAFALTEPMRKFVEKARATAIESVRRARGRERDAERAAELYTALTQAFAVQNQDAVVATARQIEGATQGVRAEVARLDRVDLVPLAQGVVNSL